MANFVNFCKTCYSFIVQEWTVKVTFSKQIGIQKRSSLAGKLNILFHFEPFFPFIFFSLLECHFLPFLNSMSSCIKGYSAAWQEILQNCLNLYSSIKQSLFLLFNSLMPDDLQFTWSKVDGNQRPIPSTMALIPTPASICCTTCWTQP